MATNKIVQFDYTPFFPQMNTDNHELTSNPHKGYNCIAWAASDPTRWWEPSKPLDVGYYWPEGVTANLKTSSLEEAFISIGYSNCIDGVQEVGVEKVALYGKEGRWTHAARQMPNGKWTSKLGPSHDITHDTPECLDSDVYGSVFTFMSKPM